MGEDPDAIRDEITDTRERMGDTIDALGYKTDVKSRAKDNVSGKVDTVKERLGGVQENPLGLAIGAVAVGFLAGMLVPSSRVENEKLGPMADRVKEQAKATGQEALDRGKEVAQSAVQADA
jgi:gas vesicle protein